MSPNFEGTTSNAVIGWFRCPAAAESLGVVMVNGV